ncbi:OLC1v1009615C1 [Oldenlandia corymbosa var. corymbosa]|uniref:OLC1v1009615C1 n=1 Tax=Oldenlandia corymbosa var. corymbosa TaxID=529605 RepID=A0AAV1DSN1_OLDCO|nr:OLC1v1009615C1 [Oldenlandia corymbosa var. corymbosa]
MKFGKEFKTHLEETLPEWRDKYLSYKPLKKLLKNIPSPEATAGVANLNPPPVQPDGDGAPALPELQDWFVKILNEELEKFNDFYVDKEEEFIIRFQELKERIERVKNREDSDIEFSDEMMNIRKDFVAIHGEMVLLKNYSSLNFAGLVKILKKYDKRTGELLRLRFTQLALHEPFFTTEPLSRLVQECEANLELLFPLEAEVVESNAALQNNAGEASSNMGTETKMSLGEETVDIYRSTLAAMRTIQGLKKASSTINPLSFSAVFANHDNDSGGDVTAENSPDSLVNSQKSEEIGNEAAVNSPK